jgi:esterase/lipase superfamily enzyme
MRRKLGKLYFRVANWRQPATILTNDYQPWFQAGCRSAHIVSDLGDEALQLAHIEIEQHQQLEQLYAHCNQQSVIIVEGIWHDWQAWHAIEHDTRTGTTFDLYYCGIVFCDTQRYKHNYRINF